MHVSVLPKGVGPGLCGASVAVSSCCSNHRYCGSGARDLADRAAYAVVAVADGARRSVAAQSSDGKARRAVGDPDAVGTAVDASEAVGHEVTGAAAMGPEVSSPPSFRASCVVARAPPYSAVQEGGGGGSEPVGSARSGALCWVSASKAGGSGAGGVSTRQAAAVLAEGERPALCVTPGSDADGSRMPLTPKESQRSGGAEDMGRLPGAASEIGVVLEGVQAAGVVPRGALADPAEKMPCGGGSWVRTPTSQPGEIWRDHGETARVGDCRPRVRIGDTCPDSLASLVPTMC